MLLEKKVMLAFQRSSLSHYYSVLRSQKVGSLGSLVLYSSIVRDDFTPYE